MYNMKQGDFTTLAKNYIHRTGYSELVLKYIADHVGAFKDNFGVAEIGAGTGKLTENLLNLGLKVIAVEPNDSMREEGIRYTVDKNVKWRKGTGEETGLDTSSANWLLMGSSFHWVDLKKGLNEFHRVLKDSGHFTALWNPRDIGRSEWHLNIENGIKKIVPELKRVSSGSGEFTKFLSRDLSSTGQFTDVVYMEQEYDILMSKDRYMGAWHSTNDIQAQAGIDRWKKIIDMIEYEVSKLEVIPVPYKTRAWTCRKVV